MTTETRYLDLLNQIPGGPYYAAGGYILPFRNGSTELKFITNFPNTQFLMLINGIQSGLINTDVNGNAIFSVFLPLGEVEIELQRANSTDKLLAFVTTRQTAVWQAALAEQLETIDDSIDNTLKAFYLDKALSTDINLAHGVILQYPNETNAELEAYRNILQFVRQSFRQFAGRTSGKYGIVAALTQVNPLIIDRSKFGPRWILGYDYLFDGLQSSTRFFDLTDLININSVGAFVTNPFVDDYTNVGTTLAYLSYNNDFKRFKWDPPDISTFGTFGIEPVNNHLWYDSPDASSDGEITIKSGRQRAFITSVRLPLPPITAGEYDHLFIEIDGLGMIDINVGFGGALTLDEVISGFIRSKNPYNLKRRASTQPAGTFANQIEILNVSDNTASGIGTISTGISPVRASYTSPGDASGSLTGINFGGITTLISDNGIDSIDVFIGGVSIATTSSDTFTIVNRYTTPAILEPAFSGDMVTIQSQIYNRFSGESSVVVHPGPGDVASFPISGSLRGHFDVPKISTTLSVAVAADDTSIEVPTGESENFSFSNGTVNTPFDIIVGYGYKTGSITDANFSITPDSSDKTAVIDITSSSEIFEIGDTHINIDGQGTFSSLGNINNGIHKILEILTTKTAKVAYGGIGISQPGSLGFANPMSGMSIINIDKKSAVGPLGALDYVVSGTLLKWFSPSDSGYGPTINIGAGGYFRLFSSNGNFIDMLIDSSALPIVDSNESVRVGGFIGVSPSPGTLRIWSNGEKVRVTGVTTGATDIWDLESPINGNYVVGQTVYLANGQYPLKNVGEESFGDLTVTLNTTNKPVGVKTDSSISISGSVLPDGWLDDSPVGTPYFVITPDSTYRKGSIFCSGVNEIILVKDLKLNNNNNIGLSFTIKAWVRNISVIDNTAATFKLGFNFGSGFIDSSDLIVSDFDDTIRQPQLISFSQIIPVDATQFKIRIRRSAVDVDFILERIVVVQDNTHGLFMGHNTIPRTSGRSNQGSIFYIWSAEDELTLEESNLLGISAPVTDGRILDIHGAYEEVDAINITDVVSGDIRNVRGAVTDLEWGTANLINMNIVARTPRRFSYILPGILSVQTETLDVSLIFPNIATLSFISDQNQSSAILFEDGIPVPQDQWVFNSSSEIDIISGFNAGAIYTFEYQVLIRAETDAIDIQVPADNGNDTWFADFVAWNRHTTGINVLRSIVSINFDGNLRAILPIRSDSNKLQSVLIEDTGVIKRLIPQQTWDYVDSLSIKISGAEFNSNAIYTLEYNQQLADIQRAVTIISEVRSAASVFSLSSANYSSFDTFVNNRIDSSLRFHQIRLTLSNVDDLRDVRIHSAIVKGIRLNTSPIVPGM